jgi:hypothetical protein
MKMKPVVLALAALLLAGGAWGGRTLWRRHQQLVTLDVREMPLAQVLAKIQRQVGTPIHAEKALDARITLHVQDRPLAYVLDRVAEQAGARWSTVFAVFGSARALQKLDSALGSNGKLESAGWEKLAPKAPPLDAGSGESGPVLQPPPNAAAPDPGGGQPHIMMARRTSGGPVVFFGGPGGHFEVWSPTELVMDTGLLKDKVNEPNLAPTADAAAMLARSLNAKWTSCVAFTKSNMGIGFAPPPPGPSGPGHVPRPPDPNERFANLTPAQRVERARQRLAHSAAMPGPH